MKRSKRIRMVAVGLVMALLSGCGHIIPLPTEKVYDQVIDGNTELMPKNVISVGDKFDYYLLLSKYKGHFECQITDAWVVQDESQCPPKEGFGKSFFLGARKDGKDVYFEYEQWFTEGGAYDHGCRIIMVDVTVTNVDAEGQVSDGTASGGDFYDPYVFNAYEVVQLTNISRVLELGEGHKSFFENPNVMYLSYRGKCFEEDIPETVGIEYNAMRIAPGETVQFTMGYAICNLTEGVPLDVSTQWLSVGANKDVDSGVFIDMKLGEDEP